MKELKNLIGPFSQILTNSAIHSRMNAAKVTRFGWDKKIKLQFQKAERALDAASAIMNQVRTGENKEVLSFEMRSEEGDLIYRVDEKLLPRDIQFNLDGDKDVITIKRENYRDAIIETTQEALEQYVTGFVLYQAKGKTKFMGVIEYDDGKREVSEFLREDFPTVTYHFEEADIKRNIHRIALEGRKENFRGGWINVEDSEEAIGDGHDWVYQTYYTPQSTEKKFQEIYTDRTMNESRRASRIGFEAKKIYQETAEQARADLLAIAAEYKENWYDE